MRYMLHLEFDAQGKSWTIFWNVRSLTAKGIATLENFLGIIYCNVNISACSTKMVITDENQLYEQWSREFRKSREKIFRHTQEQHIFLLFIRSLVYVVVIRIYYVILQGHLSIYLKLLYSSCVSFLLLYTCLKCFVLIMFNFNDIFLNQSLIAKCEFEIFLLSQMSHNCNPQNYTHNQDYKV